MLRQLRKALAGDDGDSRAPLVSFVVVVYDMPRQAENTLLSLTCAYQRGVEEADYEVVVVENESGNCLQHAFIESLPDNFSYYRRSETEPTPAHAINFGAGHCSGENICVVIDGARLLTPGVVRHVLLGHRLHASAVVTVPGYHLGHELQQDAIESGYDEARERTLLDSIGWPDDGYRLFDIACFSGSSAPGFFQPNSESNCISIPRAVWSDLGGVDPRFNLRGGGLVNLDLYKRACEHAATRHVILLGEGTFHQFHGGATTGGESGEALGRFIEQINQQYREIRGADYESPSTNPIYLGELPVPVLRFLRLSAELALEPGADPARA